MPDWWRVSGWRRSPGYAATWKAPARIAIAPACRARDRRGIDQGVPHATRRAIPVDAGAGQAARPPEQAAGAAISARVAPPAQRGAKGAGTGTEHRQARQTVR